MSHGWVIAFGTVMTSIQALSDPTQQAVLIIQSALFAVGALAVLRLPPLPPTASAATAQPLGRLFLIMQLTRVAILGALLTRPSLPLFFGLPLAWGLNMGVTTTMVRTTVQELAPADTCTQILSVLLLSFMVSSPISAILLGFLIAGADPVLALAPAVVVSFVIFLLGISRSGLWHYRAASAH